MARKGTHSVHGKTKTSKTRKKGAHHHMKMPAAALKDPWKHMGIAKGQK